MEAPPRPALATVQALWTQIDRSEAGEISVKKAQVLLRLLHSTVAALQSQYRDHSQRAEIESLAVDAASAVLQKLRDGDLLNESDAMPPSDPPETVTIKTSMNPLVPASLLEVLVQKTAADGKVSLQEIQTQVHKLMGELGWLPGRKALPNSTPLARFAPECTDDSYADSQVSCARCQYRALALPAGVEPVALSVGGSVVSVAGGAADHSVVLTLASAATNFTSFAGPSSTSPTTVSTAVDGAENIVWMSGERDIRAYMLGQAITPNASILQLDGSCILHWAGQSQCLFAGTESGTLAIWTNPSATLKSSAPGSATLYPNIAVTDADTTRKPTTTVAPSLLAAKIIQAVEVLPWAPSTVAVAVASKPTFHGIDIETGKVVYTFMGHTGGVSSLGVGDKIIISASDDHTCRIWDLRTPTLALTTLIGHSRTLYGACAATDSIVFTGGADECIKAWDVRRSKSCLYELSTGNTAVLDLRWLAAANTLCALTESKHTSSTQGAWPSGAMHRSDTYPMAFNVASSSLLLFNFSPVTEVVVP